MSTVALPDRLAERARDLFATGATVSLEWRRRQLDALARLLDERAHDFERALRHDLGKAPLESRLVELSVVRGEVRALRRNLRRWTRPRRASVPLSLQPATARVVRQPVGPVLVIAPWNYPAQLSLVPLAGALAAGCPVVLKPSELAPATADLLAEALPAVLDADAVSVATGGPEVAEGLLAEHWGHIFYTGGARVGRIVAHAAAEHLTPVTLELGGKSPVFVDDTVLDPGRLRIVAERIAWGKYVNAGQTCVAPDYVLATRRAAAVLPTAIEAAVRRFFGDDPRASDDYARIVDDRHFDRLAALVRTGTVAVGGETVADDRYIAPTVLGGVDADDPSMADEIFGPVLPVVEVADVDDAVRRIRSAAHPLALYVFTADSATARRFERETVSGALGVNVPLAHLAVPGLPFGGVGASGYGSYHGEASIRTFSHERAVLAKPLRPDTMRLISPPYGDTARWVAKRLLP